MANRKILTRSDAGVRLERIERLTAQGRAVQAMCGLSPWRRHQARWPASERGAGDGVEIEVIASLSDPVVARRDP